MKKLILALAAFGLSSVAMAGPSWTYADVGFFVGDSDGKDMETQGFALRGSLGFGAIWHAQLDYADGEFDGGKSDGGADVDGYAIRAGIHPAATDDTDWVLDLGYSSQSYDDGFGDYDYDGIDLRTGVRSNISDNIELRAFISLGSWDGDGSSDEGVEVAYSVGTQYNFNEAWSVGADASFNTSDVDLMNLYVRWSFGDMM
jgi:hypothetical protein